MSTAFAVFGWNQAVDRRVLASMPKSAPGTLTSARMANENTQYLYFALLTPYLSLDKTLNAGEENMETKDNQFDEKMFRNYCLYGICLLK